MNQQFPPPPGGGFPTPGATPPPAAQPAPQPTPTPAPAPAAPTSGPAFGGGGGGGGGGPQIPKVSRDEAAGFMKSLVDFSFYNFVSPRVLKVLYGLYLVVMALSVFGLFAFWYDALTHEGYNLDSGEYEWDPEFGLFCGSFIAYPLGLFVYILLGRVIFERGILAFRQYELTKELVELMREKS